jgi:hypothetical protein
MKRIIYLVLVAAFLVAIPASSLVSGPPECQNNCINLFKKCLNNPFEEKKACAARLAACVKLCHEKEDPCPIFPCP